MALTQAGERARGSDVYVTLEPCAHHGKTPPCCDALVAAGVSRVVVAIEDPDDRVAGRGFERLRDAGIEVVIGPGAQEARRDLRGFLLSRETGRPEVTLKLAMTLDGRIATASGESQWITGPEARRRVHGLRARHDAVMVGAGTARADDPALTVRGLGIAHQPVRVVLSRKLDIPRGSTLERTARDVPVWLCHSEDAPPAARSAWSDAGARLFEVPRDGGTVSVGAALKALADAGLTRVFCEGGGHLAAALLGQSFVDRLITFTAGCAMGAEGQPGLGAMGLAHLADAPRFNLISLEQVGQDVMAQWEARD